MWKTLSWVVPHIPKCHPRFQVLVTLFGSVHWTSLFWTVVQCKTGTNWRTVSHVWNEPGFGQDIMFVPGFLYSLFEYNWKKWKYWRSFFSSLQVWRTTSFVQSSFEKCTSQWGRKLLVARIRRLLVFQQHHWRKARAWIWGLS